MPLELTIHDKPLENPHLVLKEKNVKKVKLAIRRTLDGNLLIQDHHSMNIVIMPDKGKVLTFPKSEYNQDCYADQDDLFKHLSLNGVVKVDSINGSNLYGSLEGMYNTDKKGDEEPIEVVILNISNFLNKAKEDHSVQKKFIDDLEKQLLSPDEEDSTDLGEIPQQKFKGSIPQHGFSVKSTYRYNY